MDLSSYYSGTRYVWLDVYRRNKTIKKAILRKTAKEKGQLIKKPKQTYPGYIGQLLFFSILRSNFKSLLLQIYR